ncbi:MAG: conjugative transfer relaxase/helicase TraI [Gammaproteobacteria bacterium]|nr:conjugative transfer relaxase/helicase TraI [Gammaproteobacteria bacterium]
MITLSLIKNAAGAAQYYAKEDNYYLSEVDAKEASSWLGKGATDLGLKGKIEENELQKLLEGKLPNGLAVGLQKDSKTNHRAGYDICFHAPKSVSILALDGKDKRFYDAHLDAVKETLKIIERDCAQSKVFKNEQVRFENTKNLTVALVRHTASRALDPHLHHHALVMNVTKRQDNAWRALASSRIKNPGNINGFSERVYNNQIYYGLIYQSSLANRVVQLGCEIEAVGPHGLWEIKGVPKEARDIMSKRRQQIEERIGNLNYKSLKSADIASLDTREKKPKDLKLDAIKQVWKDELASVGFSSKEFIAELNNSKNEKGIGEKDGSETGNISTSSIEKNENSKEAIKDSIEHLSQYNLKLDYAKIIAQALEFSIGKNTHSDVVSALNDTIKNGNLIPLDKSDSIFVTKELVETEKAIMDLVDRGKGSNEKNAAITLKSRDIDIIMPSEAKDRAIDVLQSGNRISLVESKMADNTEFISAVLKLAESSGKTVRILSPNRMMTNDINENIKRKPNTLWQWLVSLGKPELGESVAGFKHKYKEEVDMPLLRFRQGKDVIVVNSSETLGCNDMHSLLELTEKSSAKVIFIRDLNAKQGFNAGNPIETIKHASIETFNISATEREANYVPELKAVRDNNDRTKQLAHAYALKEDKDRNNTMVFLGSKEQIKSTNEAIREELKKQGKLSGIEQSISVLNPVYMSKPEATLAHRYQKNMIIRFYDENHIHKDWKIESVNKKQNTLELTRDGKKRLWNPKKQEANRLIFKKETLQLAKNDKLITTGSMKDLGIKNATKVVVQHIDNKHIKLLFGTKVVKVSSDDLKDSHFQYDYATTISKYSKKQSNHVLADFKAYSLDKATIKGLTSRAKESLTIFTNDYVTAQKRFGHNQVKLSATETLLDISKTVNASNVDRFINNRTTAEIKTDIEKVISVLGNQYKLAEKVDKRAVDFAIEKITSRNAGFTHKELVTEALTYALREQISIYGNTITHEDIMNVIAEKRAAGDLVIGKHFDDGTRWTTKEILDLERSIINDIKKGQDKLEPLLDQKTVQSFVEKTNLTQDQKNACHLITTTKDQFVIIQGYAGVGKTTMFSQVKSMLKETEVLGLAPTHKAVQELKSKGIKTQTLKSFLLEQDRKQENQAESIGKNTNEPKTNHLDNKLIILDEASMVSNKDYAQFLDIVGDSKAKVVLSGDIAQHIAIGSGKPFEIIQRSNILKTAYLREIVRQKNPNLKEAVEKVIHGDYASAFEKIANENPQKYIKRIEVGHSEFFNSLKNSIVEIDNNKLKKDEKTLEKMVAEDYLSRTPETRDKTVVIVHANSDRKVINGFIREGLKEQGAIAKNGIEVNCLVPKGLTDTENKSLQSYNIGDIVRYGKEYYSVAESDQLSKSLLLKDEVGKTKYFYPEKDVDKYNIELYEHIKAELSTGDTIRLTKTDKERELYANFEYKVKKTDENAVILEGKDPNIENNQHKEVMLNPKELKDAHWDYAQTVTGYGIQGGSKTYAIDFEVSYRKNLANQRSFYIGISRAIEHLVIYTDNKARLLNRILGNKGDKYAALEVAGDLKAANNDISHSDINNKTTKATKEIKETKDLGGDKSHHNSYDAKEISKLLSNSAESLVEKLLGRPNERLSSSSEWRYGNKGSLVIRMSGDNRGLWHNFETGESGNLLTLIQKDTGLSFRETLKYAANMFTNRINIIASKQYKSDKLQINSNDQNDKVYTKNDKTSEYAKKLATESMPILGTIAERYLKGKRGISNVDSPDIRYHPKVYVGKNEKDSNQKYMPAMLSIGRDKDGNIQCVQATYLDPKTANKADLDVKKRTYSSPSGASVSLQKNKNNTEKMVDKTIEPNKNNENNKLSFIAEGVETGLSVKDAVRGIKNNDVVVTLGKSNFSNIDTRDIGQKVVFCLDNDGPKSFADNTFHKAAQRLIDSGKEVFIAIPNQINNAKTDFNDVAIMKGINAVRQDINGAISYEQFSKNFKQEDKILGNSFTNKATNNNHVFTKQQNNSFDKSKEISKSGTDMPHDNIRQITQNIQKPVHAKSGNNMNLDFEI